MLQIVSACYNLNEQRIANWHKWRSRLGDNVTCVELSLDGQFHTSSEIKITAPYAACVNFWGMKESLLNHAISQLPPEVDKVCWLDCDVIYSDDDWQDKVNVALDQYPLVQCFSHIECLDEHGSVAGIYPGAAYAVATESTAKSRVGYCWAAQRSVLSGIGLYCHPITADAGMCNAAYGRFDCPWSRRLAKPDGDLTHRRHYLTWAAQFYNRVQAKVGYIDSVAQHMYHGPEANYQRLENELTDIGYDPTKHVSYHGGYMRFTPEAPAALYRVGVQA